MFNLAHIIETALLLLVVYLIGCFAGLGLRRLLRPQRQITQAVITAATTLPVIPSPIMQAEQVVAGTIEVVAPSASLPQKQPSAAARLARMVADDGAETEASPTQRELPAPTPVSNAPEPVQPSSKLPPAPKSAKPKKPRTAKAPVPDPKPKGLAVPRASGKDNLQMVKGIGPKIEASLNELGIFHFDQMARLTAANAEWLDARFGFKGRIARENWIGQAKALVPPRKPRKP